MSLKDIYKMTFICYHNTRNKHISTHSKGGIKMEENVTRVTVNVPILNLEKAIMEDYSTPILKDYDTSLAESILGNLYHPELDKILTDEQKAAVFEYLFDGNKGYGKYGSLSSINTVSEDYSGEISALENLEIISYNHKGEDIGYKAAKLIWYLL